MKIPRLHWHEILFGTFLLVTAGRLFAAGSWRLGLGFGGMAAGIGIAGAVSAHWPVAAVTRMRLLVLPVLVNVVYCLLGTVVAQLQSGNCDAGLLRADRWLLGETPAVWCGTLIHPVLTDILSGCYLLFLPSVLAAFVVTVARPEPSGVRFFNGLFGVYALGFLGYTLVPAAGPHLAMPLAFAVPLEGGWLTQANALMVGGGSNHVDVFPSLHTAVTVFLMSWLWSRNRRLFLACLLPAAGICISTVYLRYHYAVDVAAGLCLAGVGRWLTTLTQQPHELESCIQ